MKIALGLEYDGQRYCGWQRQPDLLTVQGVLEDALTQVASHTVAVQCAGRTDTGVHATGQVVHFETHAERAERGWVFGGNQNLPKDVSIVWAKEVPETFHARFSATARAYRYVIYNHKVRPALLRQAVTWQYESLDAERMHASAQCLIGEHDFTSYRATQCQSDSPFRCIHSLFVKRQGDFVIMDIQANAFLHHMVRNIVGVLLMVGANKKPLDWPEAVLQARNRTRAGVTAPAYGLSLEKVIYPDSFELPSGRASYFSHLGDEPVC